MEAPDAIMEGQRFRLDPSIDVASLGLTPIATAVARSAQKYGFIVTDRAGTLTISTESGQAATQATGTNPWTKLMAGKPAYLIMKNFPWTRLQALPMNYGQGLPVTPAETRILSGPSRWLLGTSAKFRLSSSLPDAPFVCRLDGESHAVRTTRPPSRALCRARISSRSARWRETEGAMRRLRSPLHGPDRRRQAAHDGQLEAEEVRRGLSWHVHADLLRERGPPLPGYGRPSAGASGPNRPRLRHGKGLFPPRLAPHGEDPWQRGHTHRGVGTFFALPDWDGADRDHQWPNRQDRRPGSICAPLNIGAASATWARVLQIAADSAVGTLRTRVCECFPTCSSSGQPRVEPRPCTTTWISIRRCTCRGRRSQTSSLTPIGRMGRSTSSGTRRLTRGCSRRGCRFAGSPASLIRFGPIPMEFPPDPWCRARRAVYLYGARSCRPRHQPLPSPHRPR